MHAPTVTQQGNYVEYESGKAELGAVATAPQQKNQDRRGSLLPRTVSTDWPDSGSSSRSKTPKKKKKK